MIILIVFMLFLAESWVLIGRRVLSVTETWAFDGLCPSRPAQDDTTVQYGINDKSLAEYSSPAFANPSIPQSCVQVAMTHKIKLLFRACNLSSFSVLSMHLRYYLMKSDTTDYGNPENFEKPLGARVWAGAKCEPLVGSS